MLLFDSGIKEGIGSGKAEAVNHLHFQQILHSACTSVSSSCLIPWASHTC